MPAKASADWICDEYRCLLTMRLHKMPTTTFYSSEKQDAVSYCASAGAWIHACQYDTDTLCSNLIQNGSEASQVK
ncbi:hypothetical protein ACFFW8_09300 [Erwinia tracheiphila]|uniref:Uncharacterized protein n=1 Tax=Erwinia tracheiphila TaxID=65700 RepID=A0A345CUR8_9GAMM|nr:hypothetical protein AV903_15980 [Erwinia tracheiphila]